MPGPCAVCQQPSTLICGRCKLVNYCGKDHQKVHWKESHKESCRPNFRLEKNEKMGRYLVAARDIRKGEIILREPPLAVGPACGTAPVCLGCHVPCDHRKYHECDGCGFPLCSPRCQVSDFHVDECRLMMEAEFRLEVDRGTMGGEASYFPIVPLRCLLLKETDPDKYKKISELQSHPQDRTDTPPLHADCRENVVGFLRGRLGRTDLEEEEILNVVDILDANAFDISKRSELRGLYYISSMLARDRAPNTEHNFLEPELAIVVTATSDIKAGDVLSAACT